MALFRRRQRRGRARRIAADAKEERSLFPVWTLLVFAACAALWGFGAKLYSDRMAAYESYAAISRIVSQDTYFPGVTVDGIDLGGAATLVGVGNALTRNPALRRAVERRFGIPCAIPAVSEMAAYGAAIASRRKSDMMALNRSSGSLSV